MNYNISFYNERHDIENVSIEARTLREACYLIGITTEEVLWFWIS